tara:strand:- start:1805 stop:2275 length:471 start_codon:yes stop_codon:yes gene_type:complete
MGSTLTRYNASDMDTILDAITKNSIGLDEFFFGPGFRTSRAQANYPPYNIRKKNDSEWTIELALAGFNRDEVEVSTEANVLEVRSKSVKDSPDDEYIHRGVAARSFTRGFNISDDVEVREVEFNNGLLTINLKKVLPEHQQRRVYDIIDPVKDYKV